MIRGRLHNGNFVIGIDAENVRRLTHGEPIVIDLEELGKKWKCMIVYGQTLRDVANDLQRATGQDFSDIPLPGDPS